MLSITSQQTSAAPASVPASADIPDITQLILAWQSAGGDAVFTPLAAAATATIESAAAVLLRRRGRVDQTLLADVVSLVLDHLRRLHDSGSGERPVAAFRPVPGAGPDAGLVYLRWLTRSRAADLLRSQRRRDSHEPSFTHRFGPLAERSSGLAGALSTGDGHADSADVAAVGMAAAITGRLDAIDRAVAESLLRGEPQVEIARRLGVSEGTVTRRRQRLTARLGSHLRGSADGLAPRPRPPLEESAAALAVLSFTLAAAAGEPVELPLPRQVHVLSLVRRGHAVQACLRDGARRTIDRRPGSLAFVAAGPEPGAVMAAADEPLEIVFVVIPPEVAAAECGGSAAVRGLRDEPDFRDPSLEELLVRVGQSLGGCQAFRILRRILTLQGIVPATDGGVASRLTPGEREHLVEWIDGHLQRPLPLGDLASLFGLSVGHFARKVRNTFRLCPSRLVQQRRAIAAIALLADHDAPLSSLAARLGFASQSHFTTMFRRHVGLTPAVFRQKVHGGEAADMAAMARRIQPPAPGRAQDPGLPDVLDVRDCPAGSTAGWRR